MANSNSPSNEIPILLTSSVVAHDPGVSLKDTEERVRLAMLSVEEWLKIDPGLQLVLCDGSSFDFSKLVAKCFPQARIECLHFENDQNMVKRRGRGYGEGEIVRYALHNSKTITQAGCFAKCSSKLWVENFKECAQGWSGNFLGKGVFLNVFSPFKKTEFAYMDTRFYIADTSFYQQCFENAHLQIGKRKGYGLENCFHDILIERDLKKSLFRVAPVISGVGGGIGTYYRNSLKRKLKENFRLWLVHNNESFRNLFV